METVPLEPRYDVRGREIASSSLGRRHRPLPRRSHDTMRRRVVQRHDSASRRVRLSPRIALVALPGERAGARIAPACGRAARVPFGVGERLEYDISFGKIHVGNGGMEVLPMDTVRGRETWHTIFHVNGGLRSFYTSTIATKTGSTSARWRRFATARTSTKASYDPKRRYEIYPDRREYVEAGTRTRTRSPSVERPLDDGRSSTSCAPFRCASGWTRRFNDYFMADRNPVRIRVLRKDTIKVGAGRLRRDRRPAGDQVEGHLLRRRPGRDLAFRRRRTASCCR